MHYPSFPIRGRLEVCAGRAGLSFSLAFFDGLTQAGISRIRFPSGKQRHSKSSAYTAIMSASNSSHVDSATVPVDFTEFSVLS